MGLWEWGNFGSQKVRSVINGAIFNRSASNLVCAHDFWVFPPGKLSNIVLFIFGLIWALLAPIGTDPFWDPKITRSHMGPFLGTDG